MKRRLYLILILLTIGVLIIGIGSTRNHWWTQTNSVKVFYNGEEASNSTTYISTDGDILIWAKKGDEKLGVYCILFRDKRIGKPYPMELLAALPWTYLIRNYPFENIVDKGTEKFHPYAKKTFTENQVNFSLEKYKTFEIKF
jgi:hypothetical protein